MKSRLVLISAGLALVQNGILGAFDASLHAGLKIHVEPASSQHLKINGLPVQVVRITGPDVPELERRWIESRRMHGLRTVTMTGWRTTSLLRGNQSEVLQRRLGSKAPEVLWSSLRLGIETPRLRSASVRPPVGCRPGSVTEDESATSRFVQLTFDCPGRPEVVLRSYRQSVRQVGARDVNSWDSGFESELRSIRLHVTANHRVGRGNPGRTSLLVLELSAVRSRS